MMVVFDILIVAQTILRFAVAVALTRVVRRRPDMKNLRWLAISFWANALTNIFLATFLESPVIFAVGVLIVQPSLVMFIHETFYRDRRSPYLFFLILAIIVSLANLMMKALGGNADLATTLSAIQTAVVWLWHAMVAYRAYASLAKQRFVEDWVKARYRMMVTYAALAVVVQTAVLRLYLPEPWASIISISAFLCAVTSVVFQFLVWVMPERFRRWLDRNYQAPADGDVEFGMSEEEVMRELRGTT